MNPFIKDKSIWIKDVQFRVCRQLGAFEVQLENANSGEITTHKIFNLLQQYSTGELLTAAQLRHLRRNGQQKRRPPARMDHMSSRARSETRRHMDILVRLSNKGSFEKSRKELEEDLKLVCAERSDARVPHVSTVYRWRRRFLIAQRDVRALFCQFDKQGGKGQSRLDPEVEGIILDKIETVFLARRGCSVLTPTED